MTINPFNYLPSITTRDGRFIDPQGRQVILHGANLVNKDARMNYLGAVGPAEFAAFREWGFNCVRLGVIWDGLEPEPGVFNTSYLEGIDQQIAWAVENNLYVFLDMHQDLYSVLFSDGAPAWATLTNGQPHLNLGGVWSDAYFTSPAVQAALDNFWNNAPAPDGIGLQDHYALAWQTLARRYAHEAGVIGYDLMNEPFPGSAAAPSQYLLFQQGAELLSQLDGPSSPSAEELAMQWLDPQGRFQILERLKEVDLYTRIIDVTQPVYNQFEQGALRGMYERSARAIRAVDLHHILFLETSMGSNMGVYSGIEPLRLNDQRDAQQAYAPHGYDLVVDTANIAAASPQRVELIFARHGETARRLNLPMLVGEWGAYDHIPGTLPAAQTVARQFEKLLCSDTYWAYEAGIASADCFRGVWRPYPERVAGRLESYHFDPQTGLFECTWQEDPTLIAPSCIYLPAWLPFDRQQVTLIPNAAGYSIETDRVDSGGAWLTIPPTTQGRHRSLKIQGSLG